MSTLVNRDAFPATQVLQRGRGAVLWGGGAAGVTVTATFRGRRLVPAAVGAGMNPIATL